MKNIHSVPYNDRWAVKKEGTSKPISTHRTQKIAQEQARLLAKKNEVEVIYHKKDGVIYDKDSFGKDPNPPKDKVH